MLVTLRVLPGVPSLRRREIVRALEATLREMRGRQDFRINQYCFQSNHAHLVIEADDARALGRGMKALGARFARAVNRMLGRKGRILADRYHFEVLRTPRRVRNALAYVLLNLRKHLAQSGGVAPTAIDPASSGRWFVHWSTSIVPGRDPPVVSPPQTWLLRVGWLRWGTIDLAETPGR
jgi:REP element-mobilizing transposase RayT